MQITPSTAVLEIGQSVTLKAVPAQAGQKWSSKHPQIASVNGGVVTGVAAGSTTISVKKGTQQASAAVTVNAAEPTPEPPQPQPVPPDPTPLPPEPNPPATESPDGTEVPSATVIIDAAGGRWAFGLAVPEAPGHRYINKNGVFTEGYGSSLLYHEQKVYTFGGDGNWWVHDGTHWQTYGPTKPGTAPPPVIEVPPGTVAQSYFMSPQGSDVNDGKVPERPVQSFTKLASLVRAGEQGVLRGATFPDSIINTLPSSGASWTSPVRFIAYAGEKPVLRPVGADFTLLLSKGAPEFIEFDGIVFDGSQTVHGNVKFEATTPAYGSADPRNIRIKNYTLIGRDYPFTPGVKVYSNVLTVMPVAGTCKGHQFINGVIKGGGACDFDHAMYLSGDDVLVENADLSGFPGAGIHFYNGYELTPKGAKFLNVKVHDGRRTATGQRHWGILLGGEALVERALVYGIPSDGSTSIGIYGFAGTGSKIVQSTVTDNEWEGIVIEGAQTTVARNIGWRNAGGDYRNSGSGTINDGSNVFAIDPMFVNPAARDYHLKPGSPAAGKGAL